MICNMKYLLQLFAIFFLCTAETTTNTNNYINVNNNASLKYNITNQFLSEFVENQSETRSGEITAIVNDYADKVFENVQKLIIRSGLDPVEIPDQTLKLFPTGTINLTRGWLEDTSTIARYNDVIVTYRSSSKRITFTVPIKFQTLMFVYKYHTKALILNTTGDVQGKITSVRANISLSFDFEKYVASLDKLDITDTGRISLSFSGNGIVDWITSTMTSVASFFLHPIIIRVIQAMVKGGLDKSVTVINEAIKDVLHIA